MQLSFSCPSCGKEYDVPWSMAGKRARCKQCSNEFVVPTPYEPTPPGSSEAIPVVPGPVQEPSRPAPLPRITRIVAPKPDAPPSVSPRPVAPPPLARTPVARPPEEDPDDDPPWPHHIKKARVKEEPVLVRGALAPRPTRPTPPPPTRPPWLIPSVAGGGVALILLVNVGLYFALVGGKADRADRDQADPVEVATPEAVAEVSTDPNPVEPPRPSAPVDRPVASPKPSPTVVAKVVDDAPDRPMNTAEIVAKYESSIALIKGKKSSGTGFIARPGIVATNAHVIDGERVKELEVSFSSADEGRRGPYPAKLLFQDKARDLALLGVATDLPPLRVAQGHKFRKGEDVTVIGNPGLGTMILNNAISRGIVSSMTTLNNHSFLQLGIAINPGNSGGPVFDPKGRVIGVVTLKTTKQEGLAFAIPADDLQTALGTAESLASRDPSDGPGGSEPNARALAYGWKLGQSYVYAVELSIDTGSGRITLAGNSVYRVKAVDADGITLSHKGWLVSTRRGKDGKVVPGGVGTPEQSKEVELKIDDKGNVVNASGSSPLPLLGDFAMLLIEPLPDDPQATWDDSQTIVLKEVEQVPGASSDVGPRLARPGLDNLPRSRLSTRSRPGSRITVRPTTPPPQVKVILHEAAEQTTYTLGPAIGDKAPIRKVYELATREMVGNAPRLKMTGDGTITFDLKAGIPLAMKYRLEVVEVAGNASLKVPITVVCKLLEGKDREKGLQPPAETPTAMNKVNSGDVGRLLIDLRSPDPGKRRDACRALFDAAPIENRRSDVARALDRLAPDRDMGLRSDAIKALGVWGDGKSADALIASLRDPSFGVRDELFEAIGRLSHTEKAAEAIIPWLLTDSFRAAKALRAIGPIAEGPLLRTVVEGTETRLRQEACRLLKEVGTSQSVPGLESLARNKPDLELGPPALGAIDNISLRWPSDDDWAALMKQARSPDSGKRRNAVVRLMAIEPVEARRDEVAKALETLAVDVDAGIQSQAMIAIGSWGNQASRVFLIGRLDDPELQPVREAIEALAKLGPDQDSARVIAARIKQNRQVVIEALRVMGPVSEPACLSALKVAGIDVYGNYLCKLLGKFGGPESLPAIRKAVDGPFAIEARDALPYLEARLQGRAIPFLMTDLKGSNPRRLMLALERIASLPRSTQGVDRTELARLLDTTWDITDHATKTPLREAIVAWGDETSADVLAHRLARPETKDWEDAMLALVQLRPDARTADLLASHFPKDAGLVIQIGRKIPAELEIPLLAIVRGGGDRGSRHEALGALGAIGTPASIPALRAFAGRPGDAQLARDAEDALKAIASRQ